MTTKLNINAINDSSITFDKLANDVVMDWDAQTNEKGYIKNRTHYYDSSRLYSFDLSNADITYDDNGNISKVIFHSVTYSNNGFFIVNIAHLTNGYSLSDSMFLQKENINSVHNGFFSSYLKENDDYTYDLVCIDFVEGDSINDVFSSIKYTDTIEEFLTRLDEVYIPDTIARTSQIPTTLPANGGHADSSYMANRLDCPDTRDEQIVPSDTSRGLWTDFKQKNVTGLSAEYSGVISYRPYAQAGDWTGGPMHNLAFDENGIHHRKSNSDGTGWQGWRQIPYRDEVEKCPEYHRAEDELNIEDCTLYDPNTGDHIGSYYGTHNRTDVIFDYKYVGGNFEDTPNSYGGMLTFPWNHAKGNSSPNYASQLFIPHGDEEDTAIKFRTSQSEEWNSWRKVIDNENYTEYAAKNDHKHNVTAAGNVTLSGSVDSNGILTISATFTGTQVNASTPTA